MGIRMVFFLNKQAFSLFCIFIHNTHERIDCINLKYE